MASDLERNKENVKAFYDLMFNQCRPREAIERYAGAEYRQHNPHVADGKEVVVSKGGVGSYLPSWSPDGTQLAWAHKEIENENYKIVVANADGSNVHAISQGDGDDYQPAWGLMK